MSVMNIYKKSENLFELEEFSIWMCAYSVNKTTKKCFGTSLSQFCNKFTRWKENISEIGYVVQFVLGVGFPMFCLAWKLNGLCYEWLPFM